MMMMMMSRHSRRRRHRRRLLALTKSTLMMVGTTAQEVSPPVANAAAPVARTKRLTRPAAASHTAVATDASELTHIYLYLSICIPHSAVITRGTTFIVIIS